VTLRCPKTMISPDKLSWRRVKLGAPSPLHSAELHHFSTQGNRIRVGYHPPAGAARCLPNILSLINYPWTSREVYWFLARNCRACHKFTVYIEVGYWTGRFVGFYDDMGRGSTFDYMRYEFVMARGS